MRRRHGVRLVVLGAVVLTAGPGLHDREGSAAGVTEKARPAVAATCETPEDPIELVSVEQVRSLLVGTWVRCSGDPFAGALVDDVGLEMTADGRFYRVFELEDGSLARATGPLQEGDWSVIDNTDMNGPGFYQVDWGLVGGGRTGAHVRFFESPQTLRLDTDVPAYYRRSTGPAPDTGQPPVTVGDCPPLGDEITPRSPASAIVGTWIRCAGEPLAGALVDDVGIEVTEDGHFYRVYRLPDGTLARATGLEQEGTWDLEGQLNFHLLGSGMLATHPTFYDNPPMLHLDQFPDGAYYERWTGSPPVTGTPPPATEGCGVMADAVSITSIEQVEDLLVGVWIQCAGPAIHGPWSDDVGIEFGADGRYFRLYERYDGTLIRAEGIDQEGTWSIDLQVAPDRTIAQVASPGPVGGAQLVFFESTAPTMRLLTMIGNVDFRRWTGAAPTAGLPPNPQACGQFSGEIAPTSIEQTTEWLVGTWTLCGGFPPDQPDIWSSMFGPVAAGEVGLELAADGRYYRLFEQPDGTTTRGLGTGMEGTWQPSFNDLGGLQIEISIGGLGGEQALPRFFQSPAGMRLTATGSTADYLRDEPWPTTAEPSTQLATTGRDATDTIAAVAALAVLGGVALLTGSRSRRERAQS